MTMRHAPLLLAIVLLAACGEERTPLDDATVIERLRAAYGLRGEGLTVPAGELVAKAPPPAGLREIPYAPKDRIADGFTYVILIGEDQRRVWIRQTGGFAGATTVYGPLAMPER